MTSVATINGTKLLIQVGDGAGPEVFTADCLINTERGIQFSADTKDFVVPDCTNPDDPAWKQVLKDGLSAAINGAGLLHTGSVETWFNWWKSKDTKNIRVKIDVAAAAGGGHWQGAFHLTSFEITGNRNELATVSVGLVSSGALAWTDASA